LTVPSTNMQSASQDINSSIKRLQPIVSNTSNDMSTIVNSLPAIMEQLVIMDDELRHLRKDDNSHLESALKMHLEPVLQHFSVQILILIEYSQFAHN
jgi:hypothetical protein